MLPCCRERGRPTTGRHGILRGIPRSANLVLPALPAARHPTLDPAVSAVSLGCPTQCARSWPGNRNAARASR